MTIGKLFFGTILSQILFVISKVLFINVLNIDATLIRLALLLVTVLITTAVVRRLGILNYLESFFLIILWLIITLIVDLIITTAITGREVYTTWYFWANYFVMLLSLFLFHKKAHIQMRKTMAALKK